MHNEINPSKTLEIAEKSPDKVNWILLCQKVKMSDEFIIRNANHIDWVALWYYQPPSIEVMQECIKCVTSDFNRDFLSEVIYNRQNEKPHAKEYREARRAKFLQGNS